MRGQFKLPLQGKKTWEGQPALPADQILAITPEDREPWPRLMQNDTGGVVPAIESNTFTFMELIFFLIEIIFIKISAA